MFPKFLKHASFWLILSILAYGIWLDRLVFDGFEKLSWTMPTKVYGKSLELHPGLKIDRKRLLFELEHLNYKRVEVLSQSGEYKIFDNQIVFSPRGHVREYPKKPIKTINVRFLNRSIDKVIEAESGIELPSFTLEPILIGRINTKSFEDRMLVELNEIPKALIDTLIAVEDKNFYNHFGFDLKAVIRATISNFLTGKIIQGGSTLTQQLVKNFFLTRERTFKRKFTELLMSISLELRYSKEKILEAYCNEVFLGQDGNRAIHGFGLASWFYFDKPIKELEIIEIAALVATVKGPSIFSPSRFSDASKNRRNMVIEIMANENIIEFSVAQRLLKEDLVVTKKFSQNNFDSQAFIDLVRIQLREEYNDSDLSNGGLNIHTTFDLFLQNTIRKNLDKTLSKLGERVPSSKNAQAAVLLVDARTSQLLAVIGDKKKQNKGFNRAIHAKRQIGSMVKPFIYAKALENPKKYNLLTAIDDRNISWKLSDGTFWEPSNFNGDINGSVTILDGMVQSLNLATIDLGSKIGVSDIVEHLKNIGFPRGIKPFPSVLLGAIELSPLQLTYLYTMFLNNGYISPIKTINLVTDQNNNLIKHYPDELQPSLSPETAALINFALMQVTQDGTAKTLGNKFPNQKLGGKTGTTDNYRDSWFIGLSSNYLSTIWIGHDGNQTTGLSGSSGALQVWSDMVRELGVESLEPPRARNIVYEKVNLRDKSVVPFSCESGVMMPFVSVSNPQRLDSCGITSGEIARIQSAKRKQNKSEKNESIFFRWLKNLF